MFYKKHIFICTNQKEVGKKCCAGSGSQALSEEFRSLLKASNCLGPGKIRLSTSGCLGRCCVGPSLVIYPDGVWYRCAARSDILAIFEEHLQKDRVVTRLLTDPK